MSTTSNDKAEVHIYKHIHTQNHGTMVSHTHTHTHTKHDDSSAIKLKSMGYWDLFYKEFKKALI